MQPTTLPKNKDVIETLHELLGEEARELLEYTARGFDQGVLNLPGHDFVNRVLIQTDRSARVLRNFQSILESGRLSGTGYISILPVDQGVEHSAGASFATNPHYFDPQNIVELAIEGGCNAVASTLGVLGSMARTYAHRIPFIVKLNHNELLSLPSQTDQILFAQVEQAFDMGAVAVGATIYFGSKESNRQIKEISEVFARAHQLGMVTILWCYLRNPVFKTESGDFHTAADLTGQAIHLGATIEADIVKQKLPQINRGYTVLKFGKTDPKVYDELTPLDHPIEMTRYQVANGYMGRVPLINSGGPSGENDFAQVARTALINKRAGGMGLITGRKAFKRPMKEGIKLLHLVQDIYLASEIDIA